MKYLILAFMIGFGGYYYSQLMETKAAHQAQEANENVEVAATPEEMAAAIAPGAEIAKVEEDEDADPVNMPKRQVQIQGKYYDYRQDNTYMVDGVPTLFIPQKVEPKELIKTKVVAVARIPGARQVSADRVAAAAPVAARSAAAVKPTAVPANHPNANLAKSQQLLNMAGSNPLKVYTPDGFKALRDGLDAAKNSARERSKELESLGNGN